MEGGEPSFFTRFFTPWDSSKSAVSTEHLLLVTLRNTHRRKPSKGQTLFFCLQMHGNSFQRKLRIVKNGGTPVADVKTLLAFTFDWWFFRVYFLNFVCSFISFDVYLMIRNQNEELQLHTVAVPAFLTSRSSGQEACRLVQTGFVWGADLQRSMLLQQHLRAKMQEISQLLPR